MTKLVEMIFFIHGSVLALSTSVLAADPRVTRTKEGFVGEYFITRNADPVCVPFTRNLNQFRKLDFDVCHPRLSTKFASFSRPRWIDIPFDLAAAEKAVLPRSIGKQQISRPAEEYLQAWRNGTVALRNENKIKMWRARIDVDNDGSVDTVVRVQYGNPGSSVPVSERGCVYSGSGFYLSQAATDERRRLFAQSVRGSDVIHFKDTDKYYLVERAETEVGPAFDGRNIGATRGVLVHLAQAPDHGPTPVCNINWVPTGNYRPLRHPASKSSDR
jgi:hypothetical protein